MIVGPSYDYFWGGGCEANKLKHAKMGDHDIYYNMACKSLKEVVWEDVYAEENTQFNYSTIDTVSIGNLSDSLATALDTADYATYNSGSSHNKVFAIMAYLMANGNGYRDSTYQNAVWYNANNFLRQTGHSGMVVSGNDSSGAQLQAAVDYANRVENLQTTGVEKITDNTTKNNSGNVNTELYKESTGLYLKQGPYNWTFSGTIEYARIFNESGNEISGIKFGSYNGNNFLTGSYSEKIKSGANFYVLIPITDDLTTNKIKIKVKIGESITLYSANIQILRNNADNKTVSVTEDNKTFTKEVSIGEGSLQNLIYKEGSSKNYTVDKEFEMNYTLGTSNINVYKVDSNNNNIKLANVQFKFKHKDTGYYIKSVNGKISYTSNANDPNTIFTTDLAGKITLNNIANGNYIAIEIENSAYYQNCIGQTTNITIEANKTNTTYIENESYYGDLEIYKKDVYDNTYLINGANFVIQCADGDHKGQYIVKTKDSSGNAAQSPKNTSITQYTTDINKATVFTTGANGNDEGKIHINALLQGTYKAIEKSNSNKEYSTSEDWSNPPKWTVEVKAYKTKQYTALNRENQKNITVKGTVWTPEKTGKDETAITDETVSIYNSNSDYLVEGIKVELYTTGKYTEKRNSNGELLSVKMNSIDETLLTTTTTDSNGTYTFTISGIRYPELELPYYQVKFVYEGIDFQACTPNYDESNLPDTNKINNVYIGTSKASEDTTARDNLNNKYATITGTENNDLEIGNAINLEDTDTTDLKYTYNTEKGASTVNNISIGYKQVDKNGNEVNESNTNSVTRVKVNEGEVINPIKATYSLMSEERTGNPGYSKYYSENGAGKNPYGQVLRINLALITKESPDLAVSNQIANVVTTINGYNNLYKTTLDKRTDGTLNIDPDGSDLKVGVTYVTDEEELSKFKVYPSDVQTWENDNMPDSSKLQVYITYKVGITNESTTLYNKVKELAIYYDNNYELQYIGDSLDGSKYNYAATNEYKVTNSKYSNYNMDGYAKACIEVNGVINPNSAKEIYMTFKVSDNEVMKMLEASERGESYVPTMKNVIEINAYSTYSDGAGTKLYAGIDKDSAAGNMTMPDQIDDDTGVAREFTISQEETKIRTLTGTIFLDKTSEELRTGEERRGDSIFTEGEEGLTNANVIMEGQEGISTNIITGDEVTIKAMSYGKDNKIVTDQDGNYIISGYIPGNYILKYTYNNKTYYLDENGKENYINTEDYKSAIVMDVDGKTKVKSAFEVQDKSNLEEIIDTSTLHTDWYKIDNPISDESTEFDRYTEARDDWNIRLDIDEANKNQNILNTEDNYTTNEENTITEKQLKMTATTPLMEIAVELNTTSNNNTYTPAYYNIINMDFGITERPRQQMKLEKEVSTVKVTLANDQVLVDAVIENGKLTNTVSGMKVMGVSSSTPKGLIDIELDSELIHGATLEIGYTIKATNISEIDYLEQEYYNYGIGGNTLVTITPATIVDYVDNKLTFDQTNQANQDNKWEIVNIDDINIDEEGILYLDAQNNGTTKANINTILKTTYWSDNKVALAPGESNNSLKLNLTKLLSNTDEDMTYENDVEMLIATKTGGGTISTQIGTYTFDSSTGIGASSEEVTITPPTGITETNTTYYIIGATIALLILAGGITFIVIRRKK